DRRESVADLVELERLDDGHDDFHKYDPRLGPFLRRRLWARFAEHRRAKCRQGRRHESRPVPDRRFAPNRLETKAVSATAKGWLRPFARSRPKTGHHCIIFNRDASEQSNAYGPGTPDEVKARSLKGVDVGLAGPDAHGPIDRGDEDLAVADL